ncbi:ATP-binding protein [Actibacterium sp. XHP0104]|uniref:ATP-binding protein n=1 Tax=Actibacterium sp. XHP0104 TaxID=2984335 RepID=UPI0021E747C4|nr:ATP-binding protein [Actibacterium sp. XHP0104]MCV2881887.1 ATP-binding protein [Actibacterium sp. XHP0104]
MKYKKVFSTTRFRTSSHNTFNIDSKQKRVLIGARPGGDNRTAFLGKVIEQGKSSNILDYGVYCDVSFPHVVGIFGSRGSGKSFDLGVWLEGVFGAASTDEQRITDSAIVFDVQDQFWTLAYEPSQSVEADSDQLADLLEWGLEPKLVPNVKVLVPQTSDTEVPNSETFSISSEQLSTSDYLAILELERFSAMGQALLTLISIYGKRTPGDLAGNCVDSPELSGFQQSTIDGLRWRLEGLDGTGLITATGVEIDLLLAPGSLTVILMRNLPEMIRGLVVGVISRLVADRMGRVQQARKVADRTGSPPPPDAKKLTNRLWLVLDEAHVLVPSDGQTPATAPLVDYVKRGRDAGLSLVFATQQPSAVNSKLLSQVDITITHMLGFDTDLSAAVARMPTRSAAEYEISHERTTSMTDVLRSLGPGEAVVADGASGRTFIAKIRPRTSAHGGATPK